MRGALLAGDVRRAVKLRTSKFGTKIMTRIEELEEHEQKLNQLLGELGQVLGRRERLLDTERRHNNRARMEQIAGEAERPFEELDQDLLAEELQRELERQHDQESKLQQLLDTLSLQRQLENRLFEELERHLLNEHRDRSFEELEKQFEQRERIFESIEFLSLQETRKQLSEAADCQHELEQQLFRVIERHLVRMHQSQNQQP